MNNPLDIINPGRTPKTEIIVITIDTSNLFLYK